MTGAQGTSLLRAATRWSSPWMLGFALLVGMLAGVAVRTAAGQDIAPSAAEASSPSRFRVTGKVVNSVTGSPIPRAQVSVAPMTGRRSGSGGTGRFAGEVGADITNASGEFAVSVPSAGGWRVTAAAHGYHTQAYQEHGAFSTAIVVSEAEPVSQITFPLPPAASIEGYVLDEAGEAVRNGQLTLSVLPPAMPDNPHPRPQQRGGQRTDDRGYFKFSGLEPGEYEVRVQAQPWYATNAGQFGGMGGIGAIAGRILNGVVQNPGADGSAAAPDPLDVAYPIVWYPGVTDYAAAAPIALRPGETREADFRLSPVPAIHLRLPNPAPQSEDSTRPVQLTRSNAYLTGVLPDGTETGADVPLRFGANGEMEFSGLAPGTYLVHRQGDQGGPTGTTTIQITSTSPREIDLGQGVPETPVTVRIDPVGESSGLQISFRAAETGRVIYAQRPQELRRAMRRGPTRDAPIAAPKDSTAAPTDGTAAPKDGSAKTEDRTVSLAPGGYEVVLTGAGDLHLTGIEATGASATGRTVTIGDNPATLVLHVAHGRASVTGFVRDRGKADAGAMVLLVPATLGDPSGLNIVRRDQSNSDGSFDLNGVLPGAYILIAIDHGWDVKWNDPASLRRYLMHGLPLDLAVDSGTTKEVKETIEAQAP